MLAFWDEVLKPLIEHSAPERILEVGSDQGTTTRALLDYARSHAAVVHAIDPKPNFDVDELETEFPAASCSTRPQPRSAARPRALRRRPDRR